MSTVYHVGDDGREVSFDCLHFCAPDSPALCDRQWCRCQCHQPMADVDPQRARQLDDRDPDKLYAIANDVEREVRQPDPTADYEQLRQERFKPPPRRRCRSCGAPIIWATTSSGRAMPVDANPVAAGNLEFSRTGEQINVRVVKEGAGTHVSHYVTCPHANQWRPVRRSA